MYQLARLSNFDSRFLFVTCQHPNFNVCLNKHRYSLWDSILKLVFDGRCANIGQTLFVTVIKDFKLFILVGRVGCFYVMKIVVESLVVRL